MDVKISRLALMSMSVAFVAPGFFLSTGVSAFPGYRDLIPNGRNVPSPCLFLFKVFGVGHKSPFGGGERNNFGVDFAAAGTQWTTAFCQLDSDGDGMTNGQELGDDDCTWTTGQEPSRTSGITHPE